MVSMPIHGLFSQYAFYEVAQGNFGFLYWGLKLFPISENGYTCKMIQTPDDIQKHIEELFYKGLDEVENQYAQWFRKKGLKLRNLYLYKATNGHNDWFHWDNRLFEHELTDEIRDKAQDKMVEIRAYAIDNFKE